MSKRNAQAATKKRLNRSVFVIIWMSKQSMDENEREGGRERKREKDKERE